MLNHVLLNEHRRNYRTKLFILSALSMLVKCSPLGPPLWVAGAQKEGMCLSLFCCRTSGHIQAHRDCKKWEQLLVIVTGKVRMLSCGFSL